MTCGKSDGRFRLRLFFPFIAAKLALSLPGFFVEVGQILPLLHVLRQIVGPR